MKLPPPIPVARLLREQRLASLGLEVVAGENGLAEREIFNPRIQKPGLALAGYLPYVKPGRLQILGESEYSYLETLGVDVATERLTRIVELEVPSQTHFAGVRAGLHDLEGPALLVPPAVDHPVVSARSVEAVDHVGLAGGVQPELEARVVLEAQQVVLLPVHPVEAGVGEAVEASSAVGDAGQTVGVDRDAASDTVVDARDQGLDFWRA